MRRNYSSTTRKLTVIASLVLVFGLTMAWAVDNGGNDAREATYGSDDNLYFLVPHFSSYSYDFYEY
ncbi:hypothetical protein IH992_10960 [Candidatus Poribacteria bacterium]|nr:hypothetical protein [Candidatus Poribacteria bacterium]